MPPPRRLDRRQTKLARRRSESMLGSPLELSIPATASRQHHPLTPFPFEPKPFVRQGKQAVRECHHSLASIIDEEPSESHSQPALESSLAELPTEHAYDESSSNSEMAVSPSTTRQDSVSIFIINQALLTVLAQQRDDALHWNSAFYPVTGLCTITNPSSPV